MRRPPGPDSHMHLLPAGRRWGFGAHSVLPYLELALQARTDSPDDAAIRNPVFPPMETTLRKLRRRH